MCIKIVLQLACQLQEFEVDLQLDIMLLNTDICDDLECATSLFHALCLSQLMLRRATVVLTVVVGVGGGGAEGMPLSLFK